MNDIELLQLTLVICFGAAAVIFSFLNFIALRIMKDHQDITVFKDISFISHEHLSPIVALLNGIHKGIPSKCHHE